VIYMTASDLIVEHIDIKHNYVMFVGGAICPIETYLDIEDMVLDDADGAFSCWCNHPDLGWIEVAIYDEDGGETIH